MNAIVVNRIIHIKNFSLCSQGKFKNIYFVYKFFPYLSFLFTILVNLNHNSMPLLLVLQMLKKLTKQLNGEDWSWNNVNTLCWAIGSISGSLVEEQVCTLLLC